MQTIHSSFFPLQPLALAAALLMAAPAFAQADATPAAAGSGEATLSEVRVLGTAEEELRQAPGVSVITAEDIERRPPANDLSEIIRTMPGVNLTGNSASGQRGNNRQIDLRGMGPENTLILIDGLPVTSRNAVRYGWRGERDSRGDSNWVPAEEVERIEVLRGPAAARYGSGAAGGVVNIITKRPTDKLSGSVTTYFNSPEHGEEGDTRRLGFRLSGPLSERLTFRLYGNINKTDADQPGINADAAATNPLVAGREGVRNRDVNARLSWALLPGHTIDFDAGFSRQGSIYAGDSQNANSSDLTEQLAAVGAETNRMYRRNFSATHHGKWDFGTSRVTLSREETDNTRLKEGTAGRTEGLISGLGYGTSEYETNRAAGELNIPLRGRFSQVLTLGAEWRQEKLSDPASIQEGQDVSDGTLPGTPTSAADRSPKASSTNTALYVEDNIGIGDALILTPGLRYDYHDQFGSNWSPSLNASYELTQTFSLRGGIARAFKAPNLYQSNPNYLLRSNGNGCPVQISTGACYLIGNADLDPETSVNKEIGLAWDNGLGSNASLAYFRNDYKNKIIASTYAVAMLGTANVLQWVNSRKAVTEGIEASFSLPFGKTVKWSNNLTYMIESIDKDTGNPLSLVPEYTLNSTLDWQATEKLSAQFTATVYGEQSPPKNAINRLEGTNGVSDEKIGTYALWGASAGYRFNKNYHLRAGINNLLDKRLFRAGNSYQSGAHTYNEPGRSYYVAFTGSF